MLTDPIADYLTRVRNAQMAGHKVVDIPCLLYTSDAADD